MAEFRQLSSNTWIYATARLPAHVTSSKFQSPNSKEAPSSKLKNRRCSVGNGICFLGLVIEIWNLSGAWGLVLGVSPLPPGSLGIRTAGSKSPPPPPLQAARLQGAHKQPHRRAATFFRAPRRLVARDACRATECRCRRGKWRRRGCRFPAPPH